MNGYKIPLLVLLLAQAVLAAWLYYGKGSDAGAVTDLIGVDIATIDALEILDAKDNELRLERTELGWRVGDYPADAARVEALLSNLDGMQAPWPVGTSAEAQNRFEVAQDNFQRRLRLLQNKDAAAEVLFGTSPGFRRVHARLAGADSIYSVNFGNHDLPVGVDDWLDRDLLALGPQIHSLQRLDSFSLMKNPAADGAWELNGGPADPLEAPAFIDRFASLQVLGTVVFEGELKASFLVSTKTEALVQDYRFALYHNADMDKYYITRDDQPGRFELAGYIAEQMLLEADALVPQDGGEPGDPGATDLTQGLVDEALQTLSTPVEATQP